MAGEGTELATIDFQSMIGGPLMAVVRAQAQSAQTSVDFIKAVGFNPSVADGGDGKPTMVTFSYDKLVQTEAAVLEKPAVVADPTATPPVVGSPAVVGKAAKFEPRLFTLTVPILTMLPVPFIRIEEVTIDFNAKIKSVEERTTTESRELKIAFGLKGGWGPVSAKLNVDYSNKKSTTTGSKVERTYSLAIHVRAVQDELPEGLERLLGILEKSIDEVQTEAT